MNTVNGPTYYIQNDWEDILSKVAGEIWVTCKYKDKAGKHGRIVRVNAINSTETSPLTATEGFRANLLTYNAVEIGLSDSTFTTIFVAPRSVYSNIHKKSVTSLDISEGSVCVSVSTANDLEVVTWLTDDQEVLKSFREHAGSVYKCRWFPSGRVILSCGADMSLKIWCSETGRCPVTLRGHSKAVTDVCFIDRGRNIISVSKDGCCKLWDCGESRCIDNLIQLPSEINCCSISTSPTNMHLPDTELPSDERETGTEDKIILLGCEDGVVCCVAVRSRKLVFRTTLEAAVNCCCCIKPALFAVGCQNGNVYLIAATNKESPVVMSWLETNSPALCALPYQSKGFFIGHADGACIYRTVTDLNCLTRLSLAGSNNDPIYDLCCDGKFIYTACRDSNIRKYSPDSYISRHLDGVGRE